MKRVISGLLSVAMMMSLAVVLCACGKAQALDITGVWQRDVVFLPYYNCEVDLVFELKEDGTYSKKTTEHTTGQELDLEEGSWTFEKGVLSCVEREKQGIIRYQYDEKADVLKNGENTYRRSP